MELEELRTHLLAFPGAVQEYPFGPEAMVFKVAGKMFALVAWEETPLKVTLKSTADDALALRAEYTAIGPGYYMNKRLWNTIELDGSVPDELVFSLCKDSYELVVAGLTRAQRAEIEG